MKSFYWILAGAAALDWIVMPWLWGGNFYIKFVLAILPFALAFSPPRDLKIFFAAVLFYLRVSGSYNLGILFLALLLLVFFERWFLASFFHKTAWQTLVLSAGGLFLFYGVLLGLSAMLVWGCYSWNWSLVGSILASAIASIGFNFLFARIYKHAL